MKNRNKADRSMTALHVTIRNKTNCVAISFFCYYSSLATKPVIIIHIVVDVFLRTSKF